MTSHRASLQTMIGRKQLKRLRLDFSLFCMKTRAKIDRVFVPLLALSVFLCVRPYIQAHLDGPKSEIEPGKQGPKQSLGDIGDKQRYTQHEPYITDNDIAFRTTVFGCTSILSVQSNGVSRGSQKGLPVTFDAVFLICSDGRNFLNRQTMRMMYSDYNSTRPYRIKTVFLVGVAKDRAIQAQLENESSKYGDVLQGNFAEHYFNLTYKTVMGYRWAQLNCRDVKIILKIDDDVLVDIFKFFDYFLPVISIRQRAIYGYLNFRPRVHRKGKYWVGEDEYSGKSYPEFCSGFFVVATRDVIDDIYEVSKVVRYFRLEDVFTYAMVREAMLDVQLIHLDVITHEWLKYRDCVNDYRYRCKYFAAELPSHHQLLEYHDLAMEHRRKLGLSGGRNSVTIHRGAPVAQ